ncbi:unnamed protein product, partial [Brenthis ino]
MVDSPLGPHDAGSLGNLGNLGGLGLPLGILGNNGNGGQNIGSSDVGNIANIAQSSSSASGNNGNGGGGGSDNENNDQNDSGLSIGNIAGVLQTNINVPSGNNDQSGNYRSENGDNNNSNDVLGGQGGIGNIAGIAQSNINIPGLGGPNSQNGGLGNEEYKFERPCQVFDIYCIRKYFAEHSICKESYGPTPDPMYRPQSTIFLSRINLTVTANDVLYGGLNGRIEDFYINKETDRLVLAVEFRNLTFYAKDTYYRFHRRAREPIVTRDYLYFNYRNNLLLL